MKQQDNRQRQTYPGPNTTGVSLWIFIDLTFAKISFYIVGVWG